MIRTWSRDLDRATPETICKRALVKGPYGKEIHLNQYGTVLLFAMSIGILAVVHKATSGWLSQLQYEGKEGCVGLAG